MSLSVLVTGGAGYVGSHMVRLLLERGHQVTVLDNLSRGHRDAVLCEDFIEADLRRSEEVRRALTSRRLDLVMHFAALAYVGESVRRPADYHDNNVTGTANLLEAMRAAGVPRVVFSSSCATYGAPRQASISEVHPQDPINPYGATKLAAEAMLREAADRHGLDSVSLRYFNAAGSDPEGRIGERHDPETHLIPLVLLEALRVRDGGDPKQTALTVHGSDYPTPDGTCVRDFVHVDDLAEAHLLAAEAMGDGRIRGASAFNLGSDSGHSVLEVIEACRAVTGIRVNYRLGPRRPGDPPQLVADSRAARAQLGWTPRYQKLEDIVATAWRWFSSPGFSAKRSTRSSA